MIICNKFYAKKFFLRRKSIKNQNGLLHDAIYRIYQGVLQVKNVVMFDGTRVIVSLFRPVFIKLTKAKRNYVQISYAEFYPHRKIKV
jgi:hypothetical protein